MRILCAAHVPVCPFLRQGRTRASAARMKGTEGSATYDIEKRTDVGFLAPRSRDFGTPTYKKTLASVRSGLLT